ncbi:MAG: cytochrome b [Arenimonas sp.]|uniref:cytochrome b n=1 Tax=Arenimonas sp. TaxID=1872635 RepID=UPI0025B7E312|nr:cytochrome b [Arenimonas sp.]MBW8366673.1 cytochrome b [Arenimonas sp.]
MNTSTRYSAGQRRLHWLVFLLVAVAYVTMEFRGEFERGTLARTLMVQSHYWMGLTVLVLLLPRLWLRIRRGAPPITPRLPAWQAVISGLTHGLLYAFLLVQPVLGLVTTWADGKQILLPFIGVALPTLIAPNAGLAHTVEDLHKTIGSAFYWVIALHILAGLYHHFVRKDDTLRRMA